MSISPDTVYLTKLTMAIDINQNKHKQNLTHLQKKKKKFHLLLVLP